MSVYVILKQVEPKTDKSEVYEVVGQQEGSSEVGAIKAFLAAPYDKGSVETNGDKLGPGDFRGVPTRSWADAPHPMKPKVVW